MNKHALRLHITLFFLLLIVIINALFIMQYRFMHQEIREGAIKNFHQARHLLEMARHEGLSPEAASEQLKEYLQVSVLDEDSIDVEKYRPLADFRRLKVFETDDGFYARDDRSSREHRMLFYYPLRSALLSKIVLVAGVVNLVVLLFFLYLIKRLQPLVSLKKEIARFASGAADVSTHMGGHDEIADVANEFDRAIRTIHTLQESRTLFLRNIMHELRTPITKGKLAAALLETPKERERFERFFSRLEYLLGEFSKVERVTASDVQLKRRRYRAVDFLDNALDLLMIEHNQVSVRQQGDVSLEADFELLSIAIKNLLDNAIKYGEGRPEIAIEAHRFCVNSKGTPLVGLELEQAFNRPFENSAKGLGLGLYITSKIVKLNGFSLRYEHHGGVNRFCIDF